MKLSQFNICPSCLHVSTCLLTNQKNQVWSCSEYEGFEASTNSFSQTKEIIKHNDHQPLIHFNRINPNF
ncbi:hypothetical protein [Pseudalgibacter alginicilyticus]|uniref:hypothetical protein n=1 Tax=Pseudalgibacter alginicilyticus TaxID=1736674 RepID=UPI000A6A25D0|nr:hypothetical protein [Pseudalgibacter alginicilyticus]